ncbi:hypothetical protein DXG03_001489 [Asterophora parasitica]|uniref:DUF2235 domain-containing protein n=1 Tax=Asterophora parasitica TaxID=117018 RepID=A0A9P7G5C4_9AGAR|nr:hypothetical protein DXG03_001489 [Asterophora parasitica]
MFKSANEVGWKQSNVFKKTFSVDVKIEFIGVWDTVNSVGLIPRSLPFTTSNTIVRTFRHAVALDERRAKFKANHWNRPNAKEAALGTTDGQKPEKRPKPVKRQTLKAMERKFSEHAELPTDVEEVWFAGCHCDVGGGSVENETPHSLARIALRWMVRECFKTKTGILFMADGLRNIGLDPGTLYPEVQPRPPVAPIGQARIQDIPSSSKRAPLSTSPSQPISPLTEEEHDVLDALAPIYDQLQIKWWFWWFLELLPQHQRYQLDDKTWETKLRSNLGAARHIPKQRKGIVRIHRSVKQRMEAQHVDGKKYQPKASFQKALHLGHVVWASVDKIVADYGLATSTALPFPSATQNPSDTSKFMVAGWSLGKGAIQDNPNNLAFVADPFPNDPAPFPIPGQNLSGPVLRATYPQDSHSYETGGSQWYNLWNTTAGSKFQTMMVSYEVAFDANFDWVRGGKLPGLRGSTKSNLAGCSSGKEKGSGGSDCFSTRLMWRKNGAGEVYASIPTKNGLCLQEGVACNNDTSITSIQRGSFGFASGRWNRIALLVRLNDPPNVANGNIQLFYNDLQAINQQGLQIRTNAQSLISKQNIFRWGRSIMGNTKRGSHILSQHPPVGEQLSVQSHRKHRFLERSRPCARVRRRRWSGLGRSRGGAKHVDLRKALAAGILLNPDSPRLTTILCNHADSNLDLRGIPLVDESRGGAAYAWVKFGPSIRLAEAQTQNYVAEVLHLDPAALAVVRVPHVYLFVESGGWGYIVMEFIRGVECQRTDAPLVATAVQCLISIRSPDADVPGPVGGGLICHDFFLDRESSVAYPSVALLQDHVNAELRTERVDFSLEVEAHGLRLCLSDMNGEKFLKREDGVIVALDFGASCFLPVSFFNLALRKPESYTQRIGKLVKPPPSTQLDALLTASCSLVPYGTNNIALPRKLRSVTPYLN